MKQLDNKIIQDIRKPVKLVSFAFYVPDRKPEKQKGSVYLYTYR
jgi:hypothetical protein